jgi:hypothetical protein
MRRKMSSIFILSAVILSLSVLTLSTSADNVDQPFMRAARSDCNRSLGFLRRATQDKGGHRANAMRMVNQAIAEINEGIAYDRRHDSDFDDTDFAASSDQPNMVAAKDALKDARSNLEKATEDKGGHRVQALKWVNDAIDEAQRGIEWDRNH